MRVTIQRVFGLIEVQNWGFIKDCEQDLLVHYTMHLELNGV